MKKICANFRWCLTGTPVQNSLDDLAALVSFIRCSPLDQPQIFRKEIIFPLMKGSDLGVQKLRQFLDSICLRRTQQLLNLPETVFDTRLLDFSAKEEQYYSSTRDRLIKMIKANGLQSNSRKGYIGVFQLQLQLRRLCNHGTFQSQTSGSDNFDPEQAYAHMKEKKETKCESCDIYITGIHGIEESSSGSFTACGHLLCVKCLHRAKQQLKKIDGKESCFECSVCHTTIFGDYVVFNENLAKTSKSLAKRPSPWQYFDKNGHSTKASAVIADIESQDADDKRQVQASWTVPTNTNSPINSIVFSCWTRSLDLIEIFLRSRKIPFLRLDGTHSHVQRRVILDRYQTDTEIKILLMTTGTGGIG